MDAQLSQDSLASLLPLPEISEPATPEPAHATLPHDASLGITRVQSERVSNGTGHMTPPPSTQILTSSQRVKTRTPTPPMSHISTPPPTIETTTNSKNNRFATEVSGAMTAEQIETASADTLRTRIAELQAAFGEAKMSAAHHKLQYQMLSQESDAALQRMAVEARMAQFENEVIHVAEQAKAAATPVPRSNFDEGVIPVQKDLYQRMCREIQQLTEERNWLAEDQVHKDKTIMRQDVEIASLTDKVMLMRERIRENRDQMSRWRRTDTMSRMDSTPRSLYTDPLRSGVSSQEQPQPFAALLQASEMASQEVRQPLKKGHVRNIHSMSSVPATPHRVYKQQTQYQTPRGRQAPVHVPSTAPLPRTSALRTPETHSQQSLPLSHHRKGPLSDGTLSVDDDHSEAETDIIEQDEDDDVGESHASRAASQMLRSTQEQQAKRESFEGRGLLERGPSGNLKQTTLYGAVRKRDVDREDEPPAKRTRTEARATVGLGIAGVRD